MKHRKRLAIVADITSRSYHSFEGNGQSAEPLRLPKHPRALYERAGFSYVRPKGKNHTVMRRTVDAG